MKAERMRSEIGEMPPSISKLGNVTIEKTLDSRLISINGFVLNEQDKLLVVQRHQRAGSFTKEEEIAIAISEKGENPSNLDFIWDPPATDEGLSREKPLIQAVDTTLGQMDFIATTPRKRGFRDKEYLAQAFPSADQSSELDRLLDDADLGLIGDAYYGSYNFTPEEASRHIKESASTTWQFPQKGYYEAWVSLGFRSPNSKFKVESPEELGSRTESLIDQLPGHKNYLVTHEANCVVLKMLCKRTPEEISQLITSLEVEEPIKVYLLSKTPEINSYMDLFRTIRTTLTDSKHRHSIEPLLVNVLENLKLNSGEGNKGYGALSIFVSRFNEDGQNNLYEVAYDEQVAN